MKKTLLLLTLLMFTLLSNAQLMERKFHVSARYSVGGLDSAFYQNIGLGFEWHVHRNIGLNYSFEYMPRNDSYRHIHTPMGLIGGPILIIGSLLNMWDDDQLNDNSLGAFLGLLILALPDGVSGHFSAGYKWDISPYANGLGIDFIKNRDNGETWIKYACSFGTRVHYSITDNMTLSGFIETRKAAGHPWGIGGGLGVGYAFMAR